MEHTKKAGRHYVTFTQDDIDDLSTEIFKMFETGDGDMMVNILLAISSTSQTLSTLMRIAINDLHIPIEVLQNALNQEGYTESLNEDEDENATRH